MKTYIRFFRINFRINKIYDTLNFDNANSIKTLKCCTNIVSNITIIYKLYEYLKRSDERINDTSIYVYFSIFVCASYSSVRRLLREQSIEANEVNNDRYKDKTSIKEKGEEREREKLRYFLEIVLTVIRLCS